MEQVVHGFGLEIHDSSVQPLFTFFPDAGCDERAEFTSQLKAGQEVPEFAFR